ncbi:MAG: DNA polymerase III subunit beta [Chloroflexi bacterium]|nr:DNA polymerase III subunit beta [Chloroflexota bacterium]
MKVVCLQENLARGLNIVSRAVAAHSVLPILTHVRIATDGGRLKLSATNLEVAVQTWVNAQVEAEGAVTAPARLLSEFVSSLPPERVDLHLDAATRTLQVQCGRYIANIKGLDAQDFPLIPTIDGAAIPVTAPTLRALIDAVAFAAATDERRPVLAGVHTTLADGRLTMAAADGYRVAERAMPVDTNGSTVRAIIPARALKELARLLADGEEPIQMTVAANQVVFRQGATELVSRLIEGVFPNYRPLIPTASDLEIRCPAAELLRAVRVAALFARDDAANVVRLDLLERTTPEGGSAPVLQVSAAAHRGDNASDVDVTVTGACPEPYTAFNARYLIQVLGAAGDAQIVLGLTTPTAVGRFTLADDAGLVHVIMPMHIHPVAPEDPS